MKNLSLFGWAIKKPLIKQTVWHMDMFTYPGLVGLLHYFARNHHLDWQETHICCGIFWTSPIHKSSPQEPPFLRLLERQNARTVIINDDNPVTIARSRGKKNQALTTRLVAGSLWSVEFLILIGIHWKGKSGMLVAALKL